MIYVLIFGSISLGSFATLDECQVQADVQSERLGELVCVDSRQGLPIESVLGEVE